ncbi:GTPase-activating protein S13, partial [Friedmanniomyces endolithicus]
QQQPDQHRLTATLTGHEGAVWCVAWSHPKFGTILASSSYDGRILIWREQNAQWQRIYEFTLHTASVNLVAWSPAEVGCHLAAASSDGNVSVLTFENNTFSHAIFPAHGLGVNSVSWAPSMGPGQLTSAQAPGKGSEVQRRFVTGGSDNLVKIWSYSGTTQTYDNVATLQGHGDWVRDVAWSPTPLSKQYIASASQDHTVRIWTLPAGEDVGNAGAWKSEELQFEVVVWRVSWSMAGNVLAVAGGDNMVSLWKEKLRGGWECVKTLEE